MRRARQSVGLLALLCLFVVGRSACVPLPTFGAAKSPQMSGLYHVHSARSHDSKLTDGFIAKHAAALGHSFVILTDHNLQDATAISLRDHVLMMSATELSTPPGHICAIGAQSTLLQDATRLKNPPQAIRDAKGIAVVAHPSCPKRPYRGSLEAADGLEIVNVASTARTLWRHPRDLLELFSSWPRASRAFSLMQTYRPDETALARWDAPRETPLGGFCAADAHGRFDLKTNLMAWHLVVDLPHGSRLSGDAIVAALRDRRFVCVAGAFGRDPGLRFLAGPSGHGRESLLLRRDAEDASAGVLRLLRDGVEMRRTAGDTLVVEHPDPGLWRGEYMLWVPRVWGPPALRTVAYTQQIRSTEDTKS